MAAAITSNAAATVRAVATNEIYDGRAVSSRPSPSGNNNDDEGASSGVAHVPGYSSLRSLFENRRSIVLRGIRDRSKFALRHMYCHESSCVYIIACVDIVMVEM
jgi:hypothetical protein